MRGGKLLVTMARAALVLAFAPALGGLLLPAVGGPAGPGFPSVMAQASEKVYKAGEDKKIVPPEVVEQIPPEYPEELKNAKVAGKVVLDIVIDKTGKVTDAKILKTDDYRLDKPAVDAVLNWKYKPATLKGKPITTQWTVTIQFKLDEKK